MNLLGTKANLMYDLDFTHWDESHLADDWSTLRSQFYGESERQVVEQPRTDMFREQLEEFGLAARGEATVEVGATEAVRALAVVRAVIESSARNGEAVDAGRGHRGRPGRPPYRLRDSTCPSSAARDLDFAELPGRLSADPVPAGLGADYSVRVVRVPPGPRTPHLHPHSDEVTYVVSGTWQRLGGRRLTPVGAGDLSWCPAGRAARDRRAGDDELVLLCFFPRPTSPATSSSWTARSAADGRQAAGPRHGGGQRAEPVDLDRRATSPAREEPRRRHRHAHTGRRTGRDAVPGLQGQGLADRC